MPPMVHSLYDVIHQDVNATSITKVLINRTVSPSEMQHVIKDIVHIKSSYTSHGKTLKQNSQVYYDMLKEARHAVNWIRKLRARDDYLDPFNGTESDLFRYYIK